MAVTMQRPLSEAIPRLSDSVHDDAAQYLQPTLEHQQLALDAAKAILDPLAQSIIEAQTLRRNQNRRKRKWGSDEVEDLPVLQLRQVYTAGLGVKQVWEQARRVLDAAFNEIERAVEEHNRYADDSDTSDVAQVNGAHEDETDDREATEIAIDGTESVNTDDEEEDSELAQDLVEDIKDDMDDLSENEVDEITEEQAEVFKLDPNNLNDGFFSIDDFNKQSQFLEQMDARGDEENPSDEDEIDWDADPLGQSMSASLSKSKNREDSNNEDEDGPTFGNADLNADSDEDIDEDDLDGMMPTLDNTNDIKYSDFFAPPPKPVKSRRARALPKTQPSQLQPRAVVGREEEDDMERAMADVRRDLLDSEDETDGDSALSGSDSDRPNARQKQRRQNLSTHERQQLEIADEIRRLEALNVSKKPWTLSGEASAGARPINSLIEEDLEFERTGKPVPVITAEISNDIEALIKRRILARDFDELVRRGPQALSLAGDSRRGRSEVVVDDSKPSAGLGQLYEAEFQRNADPTSYVDKRSAATQKQHEEIDRLWDSVREQLDVLGNLHFKPKRAEINVKVVEDKPRIAMEDARPAITGINEDTMLAPQEVFHPSIDSQTTRDEILNKSGAARNKEELSREEKTRIRRRAKERARKSQTTTKSNTPATGTTRADQKETILKDLEKGGVKVIGKTGQLQNLGKTKPSKGGDAKMAAGGNLKL